MIYDLMLSRRVNIMNNAEDEDRDGLRNVDLYKIEPPYPADRPRKLHYKLNDLPFIPTVTFIIIKNTHFLLSFPANTLTLW
jgi:hypothetical protein